MTGYGIKLSQKKEKYFCGEAIQVQKSESNRQSPAVFFWGSYHSPQSHRMLVETGIATALINIVMNFVQAKKREKKSMGTLTVCLTDSPETT